MPLNPSGFYKGRHYTEWIEEVKRLKREEKFEECLVLLFGLIEATENEAKEQGWPYGAPAYYEDAAIIFRKLKRYEDEIEVLKRWKNVRTKNLIAETIEGVLTGNIVGNASTATNLKFTSQNNTCALASHHCLFERC
jgi:hypothetical protein